MCGGLLYLLVWGVKSLIIFMVNEDVLFGWSVDFFLIGYEWIRWFGDVLDNWLYFNDLGGIFECSGMYVLMYLEDCKIGR